MDRGVQFPPVGGGSGWWLAGCRRVGQLPSPPDCLTVLGSHNTLPAATRRTGLLGRGVMYVGFICSSNNHRKKPHAPKTQVQKRIHRMIVRQGRRKGCSRDSKEQSACWNQELSPNLTFFCVREWRNGRGGGNVLGSDIKPSHTRLQEVAGRQMEQG